MSKDKTVQRFFGIDLAKKESQLAVIDETGELLMQKRFASTVAGFEKIAAELGENDTVAFEMTTNAFAVARLFAGQTKARVIVSNPMQTKLIASSKNKTDKIDARVLADLARVGYLPEVWLPDERTESLRRMVSRRGNLVRRRTAVKNDIHSILHRNLIDYKTSDLFAAHGIQLIDSIDIPKLEKLLVDDYLDEIGEINKRIEQERTDHRRFYLRRSRTFAPNRSAFNDRRHFVHHRFRHSFRHRRCFALSGAGKTRFLFRSDAFKLSIRRFKDVSRKNYQTRSRRSPLVSR